MAVLCKLIRFSTGGVEAKWGHWLKSGSTGRRAEELEIRKLFQYVPFIFIFLSFIFDCMQ